MVLGFILYEAFDIVYHMSALTYNGTVYIYNWYYHNNVATEKEIEMLQLRLKDLETLLANGSNENHKTANKGEDKK